jgi:glutamyl/glutaminyl-tRNA synthetase
LLFEYDAEAALQEPSILAEMRDPGARSVALALAEELASQPRLDRERFRALVHRVKTKTGLKAKALFHPIRIALTGRADGPELDLAVPAIDRGADLPPEAGLPVVIGCRERATSFVGTLLSHADLRH